MERTAGNGMDRRLPRRRRWKTVGLIALITVAIASVAGWLRDESGISGERSAAVRVDQVTTAKVTEGEFDDFIQIRGRFVPRRTIFIETVKGGQVETTYVENGAIVEKGQLLAKLSNTALLLDVTGRETQIAEQLNGVSGLELAHVNNRLARRREAVEVDYQLARLTRRVQESITLASSGAAPSTEVADGQDELTYYQHRRKLLTEGRAATTRLEKAQLAQLRRTASRLEENLALTRATLEGLRVRAPAAGQLTAFELEVGRTLAPAERIGQIDDPSEYKVSADIDEFYLGRVGVGQHAVLGDAGDSLTVDKIRPQVTDGRFQIDLVFDGDSPTDVRRGQSAQARLQLGQASKAVLIPNAAFFRDTGGSWVFVLAEDSRYAVRREVTLGRHNPNYFEVLDGLSPGEEIVSSSYSSYLEVDRLELHHE